MAGPRSSIDVFLTLHGQRKFAKEVAASGADLEAMGLKGAKAMARFAASGEKLKRFGKSWTHNVSLPVAGLGFVAGKMAVDFHQAMSLVQTQAGASAKEAMFLERAVLRMAENSKFGATELADALFRVRSAGFKGHDALGILEQGKNLSTVGNSDLEMTTKALTGAAKNLGMHKVGELRGLAAEMNAIVGTGDMRMEELQDALSTGVLPAFVSAGLGIRDYGAALTVMTDRNVPAQVASTRLRTAISMMVPHSNKAIEALEGIGIQSEDLATIMRNRGLPAAIQFLSDHLDKLSKNKANRVMIEAFGGAKSSSTIETLVENASELPEKWDLIAKGVGKYNNQIKVAEEQPGTELMKAWHRIEVSLITLGDDLLPAVVPLFQRLASTFTTVAHVFVGLPTNVQAAAVGFLLLTGPVASGLGYFANGVGKALVLTSKLARAGKSLSIFSTAMQAGQGLPASTAMAMQGSGAQAALQTAKGFAFALGPAVAAYGIGNIVTSATQSDWQDAGFEAGGAVAGGIAGFILGGPMGAMLGVGLGSLGGELLSGLFSSGKGIPTLQDRIASSSKGIKSALEAEHDASTNLVASQSRLVRSRDKVKTSAHGLKRAEHALAAARASSPAGSRAIAKAESNVALAVEHVTRAKKRAKQAERKKGEDRVIAKEGFRYAALEQRHRKKLLTERILELRNQKKSMREQSSGMQLLQRLHPINEALVKSMDRLRGVNKQSNETFAKASDEIGPKFSTFLRHASREALDLGSNIKVAAKHQREFNEATEEAVRIREESHLPSFGFPGAHATPRGQKAGPPAPTAPGGSSVFAPPRRGGESKPRAGALFMPTTRRLSFGNTPVADIHVHVRNENVLELDGEKVAENTTRHSKRKANRE